MFQDKKPYHKLDVWVEAHKLVLITYEASKAFPKNEIFGLTSQLRRAAASVAANIVEGQAKSSKADFLRFLGISRGSLSEVEYYFELALDLNYLNKAEYELLENQRKLVGNILFGLIKSLRS